MGIIPSRNLENQRREKNGIVFFDRGTLTGKNGRRYDRYATCFPFHRMEMSFPSEPR